MTGRGLRLRVYTILATFNQEMAPGTPFEQIDPCMQHAWCEFAKRYKIVARRVPKRRDTQN